MSMAKTEPKVVLYYVPRRPGEGFNDIPKRDLTERDVARLTGAQLANATSPHPNGQPALYQKSPPSGTRAKTAEAAKEQAAPSPTTDKE